MRRVTAIYIDKRLDAATAMYCRLTLAEFRDLLDSAQIRFHGRGTVWPASLAERGARMPCGVAVQIPQVWRDRLQTPEPESAWVDSQALIGMQRWFLSAPPEGQPDSVILRSSVGALANAAQACEGLRLVIAPVRYAAPIMQRSGGMRLPDLFSGKVQRRREREARVIAMQDQEAQGPEGITRVRRALAFALTTLVCGVMAPAALPDETLQWVAELAQTRLGLLVSRLG
ncbi:hypothetical protein CAL22_08700 [Bordetella genomosp. 12]|uniref:Uncharacterized protein n=2 Tax=Bordetella genomosp. 12 TaxID=463035 RepID=A0A261VLA5_9BORD|nr:hypothetical protein CAL22_08700 [Bordetella genomosp. 12]